MRHTNIVALSNLVLSLLLNIGIGPSVAHAFEIEDKQLFNVASPEHTLHILSTTDLNYFSPLINTFQDRFPTVSVVYTVASSKELFKAIYDENAPYDLVISSAMDLQVKLVNDGLTQGYVSDSTEAMPEWAQWRNHLFAFTQEPAVLVASKRGLGDFPVPKNRQELISLLRDNLDHFAGKVGTYDIRESGAGYLFATQDARQSDVFWRLAEVVGSINPKLYCCSSDMLNDLESGKITFAYNVVGSYASANLYSNRDAFIVPLSDYTHFMLRTALIPSNANNPELSGQFINFLIDAAGRKLIKQQAGLPPIDGEALTQHQYYRPISLGPGLLVYLDRIKRRNFLAAWTAAMVR